MRESRPVATGGRLRAGLTAAVLVMCGVLAALGSTARATVPPRFIDYLYIEANEGGSSGGHTALRFDSEVFHFQRGEAGLLRLQRDDAAAFAVRYALFGNRPIHETRVAVSAETYALMHDAFARRLLVQSAQYERLDALQADVELFHRWMQPSGGVPVRAAGYFLPDGFPAASAPSDGSAALIALRARVAERYGDAFIAQRIAASRSALADWQPRSAESPAPVLTRDAYPSLAPTASTELAEQLAGLTALEVLRAAPPLRAGTYRVADQLPPLTEPERERLAAFADALSAELASLAGSPRADFGYPLLLGMARLAAIEASAAGGHLVVLDAFASDGPPIPLPQGADRTRFLDALAVLLQPAVDRSRRDLFAGTDFREADYTELESAVNRLLEVTDARRSGGSMRMEPDLLLPSAAARRAELIAPPLPEVTSRARVAGARAALTDYRARLAEIYGYNLISQNCVSEIFSTVAAAFADRTDDDATTAKESDRRLGGFVRTTGTLNFIPFVSAAAVEHSYRAVARRTYPSYRELRLAAMANDEPAWRVYLRESNTLTSTSYRAGPNDSVFLFFTDNAVALRPILGAANLVVGVADGLLGLATWPADAGARLRAGWRGALFSLPELAFVNIRKGSTAWIDPSDVAAAQANW